MEIYLAKVSWTNPKNNLQHLKREFITAGEGPDEAEDKIILLVGDLMAIVDVDIRLVEIPIPYEIF